MVNYNFFFFSDPENQDSEVPVTMKLTNEIFKAELTNNSSESYQNLTSRVKNAVCH